MLKGRTVLVVEAEFIIALSLEATLQTMGAGNVVIFSNAESARTQHLDWSVVALAVVELGVDDPAAMNFARNIVQRGIPLIGISADGELAAGVPDLPGTPVLLKPLPDQELTEAIHVALAQKP